MLCSSEDKEIPMPHWEEHSDQWGRDKGMYGCCANVVAFQSPGVPGDLISLSHIVFCSHTFGALSDPLFLDGVALCSGLPKMVEGLALFASHKATYEAVF